MINFNFRLERVLNYKENMEELKKAEYGTTRRKLNHEEDKLEEYTHHKNSIKDEKNIRASKTKVGSLAMYNNYILDLDKKIKTQENIVNNVEKELEKAKEEMIVAVQEKKTFERLKEREYEKHLYQIKKNEEKLVDSIVNYKTSTQQ